MLDRLANIWRDPAVRRPLQRQLRDDPLSRFHPFHARQDMGQGVTARLDQGFAAKGLEWHPGGAGQRELADQRTLTRAHDQRVPRRVHREDFCLGVLGLELLAQQGQLGPGAGAEQEHLLAPVSREFQRERLIGGAGLKPVLHGLRLQLSLVKRHDHEQVRAPLRLV